MASTRSIIMNHETNSDSLVLTRDNARPNGNHENDVKHMIKYTKWLLELLGVWPLVKKKPRKIEIFLSIITIITSLILIAFVLIPCILHIILRERNRSVKIKFLGGIGFRIGNIVKYFCMIYRRDVIKMCIEHVEKDWMMSKSAKDREIMKKNAITGRKITILSCIFMFSSGMSYHTIMPLYRGNKINSLNQTIRPLVYPGHDIFVDAQSSPEYEIIFGTTCISAGVTYIVVTAGCSLAAIFVSHACGQIEIIISRLDNLFDDLDDNSDVVNERLMFVIRSHARVLRLSGTIEKVLSEICLVEVVVSTLIMCLIEYYCMTWENSDTVAIITYFMYLISLGFNIFMFCHIGERLKDKWCQIGKATYQVDWYRFSGKNGQALVMLIAMADYPRKLRAGGMIELSITSFGTIIKTSVTYLNMLRALTD